MRLLPVGGPGPEDVVVDARGRLVAGLADGRIQRVDPGSGEIETLADTGGRPLGLEVLPDGDVLVCDSHRGLLRLVLPEARLETLVAEVDGAPLRFCSNVVAASDGTIYFTDSTRRFHFEDWKAAVVEQRATGRLFRLDTSGRVDVLLDGLLFANGVALAADESYLLVAETTGYRLNRYWLTGDKAGNVEPLVDNLPGFPDNISRAPDGSIWVAMANVRDPMIDRLHRSPPVLRKILWALPERLLPQAKRTTWVISVGADGRIVRDLQAPGDDIPFVTGVVQHRDRLYLSSIEGDNLAVLDLA